MVENKEMRAMNSSVVKMSFFSFLILFLARRVVERGKRAVVS